MRNIIMIIIKTSRLTARTATSIFAQPFWERYSFGSYFLYWKMEMMMMTVDRLKFHEN